MFRLLLLLAIGFIAYTLYKRISQDKTSSRQPAQPPELPMKKCAYCGLHLPEQDALTYQTLHFCNDEHKQRYLEQQDEPH